jgi:hypothetical protein
MPKVKQTKKDRKIEMEREMQRFLLRVGYKGPPKEPVNEIPNYKTDNFKHTSNKIPGRCPKVKESSYSGTEIAGIVTTHKSNLMPIRKDNKQAAIDAAQMRRN